MPKKLTLFPSSFLSFRSPFDHIHINIYVSINVIYIYGCIGSEIAPPCMENVPSFQAVGTWAPTFFKSRILYTLTHTHTHTRIHTRTHIDVRVGSKAFFPSWNIFICINIKNEMDKKKLGEVSAPGLLLSASFGGSQKGSFQLSISLNNGKGNNNDDNNKKK